ncbi:MAG: undecaprenyl-phosphate glucose phosphotransferase [Oxalobacteraceae bacterium]
MHDLIEKHSPELDYVVRAMDVLIIVSAGSLAAMLRFSMSPEALAPVHQIVLYACAAMSLVVLPQCDLYSSWRGRSYRLMTSHACLAMLLIIGTGIMLSFLLRQIDDLSRLWVVIWYVLSVGGLLGSRMLLYAALAGLRRLGFNQKRVIIIGYGAMGREMHRRARQQHWAGYCVRAVHDAGPIAPLGAGIDILHDLQQLPQAILKYHAHEVWITLPLSESARLQPLQYLLRNSLVDIRWVPDTAAMRILSQRTVEFLGLPVVELNRPASAGIHGLAKALFDRLFALGALVALMPLLLTLAVLIKASSPGPVLFRQPRLGLNGRIFHVYKFRSMKLHQAPSDQVKQATRNDPRVTPIGRFMRRTSLDELPQFLNVLLGDMSVVGPRPHALSHNDLYKDKLVMYMQRHRVKPGITGWAQIHGFRGETDTEEKMARRVACDLHYIQHWSFWLDLRIILWTSFKGWIHTNAY